MKQLIENNGTKSSSPTLDYVNIGLQFVNATLELNTHGFVNADFRLHQYLVHQEVNGKLRVKLNDLDEVTKESRRCLTQTYEDTYISPEADSNHKLQTARRKLAQQCGGSISSAVHDATQVSGLLRALSLILPLATWEALLDAISASP